MTMQKMVAAALLVALSGPAGALPAPKLVLSDLKDLPS